MSEEKGEHWSSIKARDLIQGYIGPDHKVMDMKRFNDALTKALDEAHEEGLEAGLLLGGASCHRRSGKKKAPIVQRALASAGALLLCSACREGTHA
jgi:hypothetical protein